MQPFYVIWSQLCSRKFWHILLAGLMIFGTLYITWSSYGTPAAKAIAYSTAMVSFAGVCGINIRAIASEDVSLNQGAGQVKRTTETVNEDTGAKSKVETTVPIPAVAPTADTIKPRESAPAPAPIPPLDLTGNQPESK